MRVLIVNTSEMTGGAAIAANRLTVALNNSGVKAKMMVMHKDTTSIYVAQQGDGLPGRWHFLRERLGIFLANRLSRDNLFAVSTASTGTDITHTREFQEADIIHLHWVNQGFLSLSSLKKILNSGKPVVWTMHDIWPATAICHLAMDCQRFKTHCTHCPYIKGGIDLAARVWRRKQRLLEGHQVAFVACSQWLKEETQQSALLQGQRIESIPNPIDTHLFHSSGKVEARQRLGLPKSGRMLLFAAQRATNGNKGIDYLAEACRTLRQRYPDIVADWHLLVMGGQADEVASKFPLPVHALGYIGDAHRLVDAFNAADVFALPSLSENLPNTLMEAMATGTPCIGFRVGGIPEMIDHKQNGYVADYKSSGDLADGLRWLLSEANLATLGRNATHKVATCYSQQAVANRYIQLYNELSKTEA